MSQRQGWLSQNVTSDQTDKTRQHLFDSNVAKHVISKECSTHDLKLSFRVACTWCFILYSLSLNPHSALINEDKIVESKVLSKWFHTPSSLQLWIFGYLTKLCEFERQFGIEWAERSQLGRTEEEVDVISSIAGYYRLKWFKESTKKTRSWCHMHWSHMTNGSTRRVWSAH